MSVTASKPTSPVPPIYKQASILYSSKKPNSTALKVLTKTILFLNGPSFIACKTDFSSSVIAKYLSVPADKSLPSPPVLERINIAASL